MPKEKHWTGVPAPYETDTLYARPGNQLYDWVVSQARYGVVAVVHSDSANHACDWVCTTKWTSRLDLTAQSAEDGE